VHARGRWTVVIMNAIAVVACSRTTRVRGTWERFTAHHRASCGGRAAFRRALAGGVSRARICVLWTAWQANVTGLRATALNMLHTQFRADLRWGC